MQDRSGLRRHWVNRVTHFSIITQPMPLSYNSRSTLLQHYLQFIMTAMPLGNVVVLVGLSHLTKCKYFYMTESTHVPGKFNVCDINKHLSCETLQRWVGMIFFDPVLIFNSLPQGGAFACSLGAISVILRNLLAQYCAWLDDRYPIMC